MNFERRGPLAAGFPLKSTALRFDPVIERQKTAIGTARDLVEFAGPDRNRAAGTQRRECCRSIELLRQNALRLHAGGWDSKL